MSTFKSLSALLLVFAIGGTAAAQSNSSANITGEAKAGDTVLIFSPDTGMKRELVIQKDGKFRARSLPVGTYQVTIKHADGSVSATRTATLRVGATAYIAADDPASTAPAGAQPPAPEEAPDKP